MATESPPDFRALAIHVLSNDAMSYPPAGWAAGFDAKHAGIPAWALDGEKPHEMYLRAASRGKSPPSSGGATPSYAAMLWNQVYAWLVAHPGAPEIADKAAEIADAWGCRNEYPEDWAPYQRIIDLEADGYVLY